MEMSPLYGEIASHMVLVKLTIFKLILQIRLYKVLDGLRRQQLALGQHGRSEGSTWAAGVSEQDL